MLISRNKHIQQQVRDPFWRTLYRRDAIHEAHTDVFTAGSTKSVASVLQFKVLN